MEKISLEKILEWTNGKLNNDEDNKNKNEIMINNISKDTRTIKNGEIYIALPGKKFDGHDFINDAFKNGCSYAIASSLDKVSDEYKDKIILVNDIMEALNNISSNYISYLNIPVVGITGSVGKTTMKEMIATCLSEKYKVLKTSENLNNTIGAPFTALELDSSYDIAVIEGGMNHKGEIESISSAITPSVVVITNIGESHIGNLGSRENIFKEKCEMISHAKKDALIILNKDDDYLPLIKDDSNYSSHKIIYKGLSDITDEKVNKENGYVNYSLDNFNFTISSLVKNIAFAAIIAREVCKHFKMNDEEIKNGISKFKNISNRLEETKLKKLTTLNDYYNSSFVSIESAIATLTNYKDDKNKTIAIIGDILETGEYEKEIHTNIGIMLNKYKIDKIYFVGNAIKNAFDNYHGDKEYFDDKEKLINEINDKTFTDNDVILLKASHGCEFGFIFDKIKEIYN